MADDGLLMNFSIENDIIRLKPVFRGGRWKDRLTARKSAEYRRMKLSTKGQQHTGTNPVLPAKVTQEPSPEELPVPRLFKRQKVTDTAVPRSNYPREIVSSLFSSNPTSNLPPQDPSPDITPSAPSNAPLLNSLHTFTSLGLSPQLATHLLTKLSLRSPTAIQKSAITQLLSEDSDAFLQAETGSGKTLAYLLPIVQRIMHLLNPATANNSTSPTGAESLPRQVHRSSGLFAIILAPTRELCKQISAVLENLLRCVHWIVAGTVTGGEKKKSEKARLRKGLNILVATPGRLADHLENTEVLDVSRVRWLVLDEGDRLMELGFEEEIKEIVKKLEEQKFRAGKSTKGVGIMPRLPERRTTVMCSATMKMTVQRLGEISLKDAVHIKAEPENPSAEQPTGNTKDDEEFSVPTQLKQSYAIVPAKQRLVTLAALLRRTFARRGSVMKAIVFLSCADSVDFHFEVFARDTPVSHPHIPNQSLRNMSNGGTENPSQMAPPTPQPPLSLLSTVSQTPTLTHPLNPQLTLHKLHGSLAQSLRTATLSAFTRSQHPCILLCTDVASRGLDLPNIDLVIEYDPPFSSDEHLHRVGRTARAGREGRAVIFLMPGGEEGYVDILKRGYRNGMGKGLVRNESEQTLKKGFENEVGSVSAKISEFTGRRNWEERATEWQLEVERWVIEDKLAGELAQRAFISHVRAYATHIAREREMFDVKGLHLGHLAKAFALRDRPGNVGRRSIVDGKGSRRNESRKQKIKSDYGESRSKVETRLANSDLQVPLRNSQDAGRRMKVKMEEHMAVASEFNIG